MPAIRLALWAWIASAAGTVWALPANTLSPCEQRTGFELLFDGTRAGFREHFTAYVQGDTLTEDLPKGWTVSETDSAVHTTRMVNDLRSFRRFGDFDLRFEYRNDGHAGVFYRASTLGQSILHTGMEFKVSDNTSPAGESLHDETTGALWGMLKPTVDAHYPYASGKWNQARVVADRDSVEHWLNGVKVLAFRMHSEEWWYRKSRGWYKADTVYAMEIPGDKAAGPKLDGYIGLQGDWGGKWSLRTLRINGTPRLGAADAEGCQVAAAGPAKGHVGASAIPVLRREPDGAAMVWKTGAPREAELVSWDGRIVSRAPVRDGRAHFAGAYPRGVYGVRCLTAAGASVFRIILP